MYLHAVTFFLIFLIIVNNMPTAKATVTEVYAEQHQSKSVFRLGTRVTDKSKNPSWDNKTVHSGHIYEKLADAMADKNLFRWFYSSRGWSRTA